jgi:hypothetical protein
LRVVKKFGVDGERPRDEEPTAAGQSESLARMMTGSVAAQGLALLAVAIIVILSVVLYGLNGPSETNPNAAVAPAPAASSSGSASPAAPQNGGK